MIEKGDQFNIKHEPRGNNWFMSGPYVCLYVKSIPPSESFIVAYREHDGGLVKKRNIKDCVKIMEDFE